MNQDREYQEARTMLEAIRELEDSGVLGSEKMPEEWGNSWPVLRPAELPYGWMREHYSKYGEIRYYWH